MFCKNCGNQMDPIAAVCVKCGVKTGVGNNYCQNCGQPTNPGSAFCTGCGAALNSYVPASDKSKIAAGLLGIFLGGLGIHRFYLGYTGLGVIQIVVSILTCGIGSIWGFIEGILILCGVSITTDAQGRPLSN